MAMSQELTCASFHCSNTWSLTMPNITKEAEVPHTFFKTGNGQRRSVKLVKKLRYNPYVASASPADHCQGLRVDPVHAWRRS
eukprot:2323151-Prorocentrum_lima.AAC.1